MRLLDILHYQHDHSFGQDAKRSGESRKLIKIVITAVMMVVEISTGIHFGSMALVADRMHMASHALALGITNYFDYIYARRARHDPRFSFGTGKVNTLGGFSGAIPLAPFATMMAWESMDRLTHPTQIVFNSAILAAFIVLIVNGVSVVIPGGDHHHDHDDGYSHSRGHSNSHEYHHHGAHEQQLHDHNLVSAYLHVLAGSLTFVTAIIALLAAKYFDLIRVGPLMGIVGSLLIAKWSIGLFK